MHLGCNRQWQHIPFHSRIIHIKNQIPFNNGHLTILFLWIHTENSYSIIQTLKNNIWMNKTKHFWTFVFFKRKHGLLSKNFLTQKTVKNYFKHFLIFWKKIESIYNWNILVYFKSWFNISTQHTKQKNKNSTKEG